MEKQTRGILLLLAGLFLLSTFASGQTLEKPTISLGDALVHPLEETSLPLQLSGLEVEAIVYLRLKFSSVDILKESILEPSRRRRR